MSTPDPFGDALAAQAAGTNTNPDPFGAALEARSTGGMSTTPVARPGHAAPVTDENPFEYAGSSLIGAGETALSGITGGAGALADALTGSDPGTHDWSYRPRTQAGKEISQGLSDLITPINKAAVKGGGAIVGALGGNRQAAEDTLAERIPEAQGALSTAVPLLKGVGGLYDTLAPRPYVDPQELLNRAAAGKSMGAASTAPAIGAASNDLKNAIGIEAQKTGGAVNPDALTRHLEADSLPVPIKLTEGQALQDPVTLSNEQNMRAKQPQLAARFNEQNQQLVDNIRAIREGAGPDVFSTSPVEHGDTLIQAYKDKAAVADADIASKYQALKDANGGQFPVDAKALNDNASDALHQNLLFDHAPTAVMSTLNRLADKGNMTFEQYEALRTNLARVQRTATDGNERAAAGVIRNSMEQLPLQSGAAALKPLADTARSAARTQFEALKADPAYDAAVNDKVSPDRFVQKFIVGAPRDDVATMRANLADNDRATQTMGVAAIDHLRQSAGVDAVGNGNVSQASFNKQLDNLRPKLGSLMPPEQANQLDTLGKVARYTQFQPRGSFVNNSNTFTAAMGDHVAGTLEGAANVAAHGVPIGTWTRKGLEGRAARQAVEKALAPGAGLGRLDLVRPAP